MEQRPAPVPVFPTDTVLSRDHGRLKRLLGALRKAPGDAAARAAWDQAERENDRVYEWVK